MCRKLSGKLHIILYKWMLGHINQHDHMYGIKLHVIMYERMLRNINWLNFLYRIILLKWMYKSVYCNMWLYLL